MAEEQQELELSAGDKKLRFRGSDWLSLLTVAIGSLLLYILFEHRMDAKAMSNDFNAVVKEMVNAQKEMVSAQREQNCLIAFTQEVRERNTEFCKRMARDR